MIKMICIVVVNSIPKKTSVWFCQSYRWLISNPHDEQANFQVAFSTRAGVVRVAQEEPLPHHTVG